MKVAGTGHRPDKLGGYEPEPFNKLVEVAESELKKLMKMAADIQVISGMAMGWDMALAQAAINLGIPLIAAIPFKGQESMWEEETIKYYNELLSKSARIEVVCEGEYVREKMQIRNEWMVDNSDLILAMYNGDTFGGTYNCIRYAEKVKKPIINLYKKFKP